MISSGKKAIEDGFPVGLISCLAERESWRKEIYRPVYYIHKWWARRLGSVFRAIIVGCCSERGKNIGDIFYKPERFPNIVIFDPFMGSGPTKGLHSINNWEATDLGIGKVEGAKKRLAGRIE